MLGGRTAHGAFAYLGRYHQQVSCLREGKEREMLHYMRAGVEKHSILNIYISADGWKEVRVLHVHQRQSARHGAGGQLRGGHASGRAADPAAACLDRGDTEVAQKLGCLELDEEDLALCTYVCAGKYEYGPILRDNLTRIEKEG